MFLLRYTSCAENFKKELSEEKWKIYNHVKLKL